MIIVVYFLSQFLFGQKEMTPEEYIAAYKEDAIKEMYLHKVPACITLAQAMLESGNGNSLLAKNAKNHFGIKCHKEWGGDSYIMDDDSANECFRKYNDALESFSDHSLFLCSRSRYSSLFKLDINDYKGWCYGLKAAGYATDPKYPERLIDLIEKYKLHELNVLENSPRQDILKAHINNSDLHLSIREVYRFNHVKFVIAKENDSFYKIANDFNLELDQILEYNDFSKDEKLTYGQKIYIEKKRRRALEPIHVVQKNETLKSISQLHGIRLSSVCKKNHLKPHDKLKIGDVIYLRHKKDKPE